MTTSALKRRSFLQGSLLAAAVIGSTPAVAAEAAKPKFDESFDVIVVGSIPHQRSELCLCRFSRSKG